MSKKILACAYIIIAAMAYGTSKANADDETVSVGATAAGTTATGGTTVTAAGTTATGAQFHDDTAYVQHVETRYLDTAGTHDNLTSLTSGLRTGGMITLQDGTGTTVSFNAPTKPMGYGNITHTLDLASRQLAAAGITSPTADQLHAALMGGTVTNASGQTTTLNGVLQLRSQGMGWGQIAHTINLPPSPNAAATSTSRTTVTTLAGSSSRGSSGITTAGGGSGQAHVSGDKSGKSGIVTAGGSGGGQAAASHGNGGETHARSGIVTAGGSSAGFATGVEHSHSIVLGGGGSVSGGISTGGGSSSGHGNAFGKGKN